VACVRVQWRTLEDETVWKSTSCGMRTSTVNESRVRNSTAVVCVWVWQTPVQCGNVLYAKFQE
jgi:hypothetical protein